MSKRRGRRLVWKEAMILADAVVIALQHRAREIAEEHAHALGSWQSAKRRWGRGARIGWCSRCDMDVVVLPRGAGYLGSYSDTPAIAGPALFEECNGNKQKHTTAR